MSLNMLKSAWRGAWLSVLALLYGLEVAGAATNPASATFQLVEFGVYWPPQDPLESPKTKLLLSGCLQAELPASGDTGLVARLCITLTRPSDEPAREFWNSRLAFSEYDWMRYVRVWDADRRWLWPNLP